jgi:glycosyltransferase involved in cell wall biosynthesis
MLLSVVVPVYEVRSYLDEAIESILATAPRPVEVIAVDDGSTDGSSEVLASLEARHPSELRVITTANAGSGAARNLAASRAQGTYLTFVDPDDVVLDGTHDRLVRSLERTGSDFAVCHFERLHPDGRRSSLGWADRVHARARERARLDDVPEIVGDVFCWNKVFRREFWQRQGIRFPEGTRYQDQPPITEAFLRAEAFDVDPRTGYLWRVREEGTSVTQGRSDLGNLQDRVTTKSATWDLVQQLGSPEVVRLFHDRVMPGDLHHYFDAVPTCDPEYWALLQAMVSDLWGRDASLADSELLPSHRVMGWLVEQDRRDDASRWWRHVQGGRGRGPLPVRPTADLTALRLDTASVEPTPVEEVPDAVARLRSDEIGWSAEITATRRRLRGTQVSGTVTIGRLGTRRPFTTRITSGRVPVVSVDVDTPYGRVTLTGPLPAPTDAHEAP